MAASAGCACTRSARRTVIRSPAMAVGTSRATAKARGTRSGQNGAARPGRGSNKWVYLFEEGDASMRELLGGKGAGVAEMTRAGLPVPPGFTITTAACNAFYDGKRRFPDGLWEQALEALAHVEKQTGKRFGDTKNPL